MDGVVLNFIPTQRTGWRLSFVIGLHLYFWPWIDSVFPDTSLRLSRVNPPPLVGGLYVHGSLVSRRSLS